MPFTFCVHQDIKTINHNKCLTNLLPYYLQWSTQLSNEEGGHFEDVISP